MIDGKSRLVTRTRLPDDFALEEITGISADSRPIVYVSGHATASVLVYAPEAYATVFGFTRIEGEEWLSGKEYNGLAIEAVQASIRKVGNTTHSILKLCDSTSCSIVEGVDDTDVEVRTFVATDALFGQEHALLIYDNSNLTLYNLKDTVNAQNELAATTLLDSASCQTLSRASDNPRTWVLGQCYEFESSPEFSISGEFAFLSSYPSGIGLLDISGVEKNTAGAHAVQIAQNKTMLVAVYEDGSAWLTPNK